MSPLGRLRALLGAWAAPGAPPGEPPDLAKARPAPAAPAPEPGLAWQFDPRELLAASAQGWVQPPPRIDFGLLRQMSRIPPVAAIVQTRLNQLAAFARPQLSPYRPGFKLLLRDRKRSPKRTERRAIEEATRFFTDCGVPPEGDERFVRPTFEAFLRQLFRDSLELDSAGFEVLFDRAGRPAGFQAVDGATLRRAVPDLGRPTDGPLTQVVQVVSARVVAEWEAGACCLGIRRPRTDLASHGYGYSEIEELVRLVTAWLYGFDYNMAYFRQGSAVKGFFKTVGMPEGLFNAAQRQWKAMVSGVTNAHVTPWFNVPDKEGDIKFEQLQLTNTEMQFFEWLGWLYRLICADYQIDPAETGFSFGNEGQAAALSDRGPADRIRSSQTRGLAPLLRVGESWFNAYLVWPRWPELEFAFAGEDAETEGQRVELDHKRGRTTHTVNELRAQDDLPPLPWGDVILDPVALQARSGGSGQDAPGEPGRPAPGAPQPSRPAPTWGWGDDEDLGEDPEVPEEDDEDGEDDEDDEDPERPGEPPPRRAADSTAPVRRSLPPSRSRRRLIDLLL